MKFYYSFIVVVIGVLFLSSCKEERKVEPFVDKLTIAQTNFVVNEFPANGTAIVVLKAKSKRRGVRINYELLHAAPNDGSFELLSNGTIISHNQKKLIFPDREYSFLTVRAYTEELSIEFQVEIRLQKLSVQSNLNKGVSPYLIYSRFSSVDSLLGKKFQGGIIAQYLPYQKKCFIASPKSLDSLYRWGCNSVSVDTRFYAGEGERNTKVIMSSCKLGKMAAAACDSFNNEGYADWFLPSLYELRFIQENLYKKGMGSFGSKGVYKYWSSTGNNSRTAFCMQFKDGLHIIEDREAIEGAVHPMRIYTEP